MVHFKFVKFYYFLEWGLISFVDMACNLPDAPSDTTATNLKE